MDTNNIITAMYNESGVTKVGKTRQWAKGQVLSLVGFPNLPASFAVYFQNADGTPINGEGVVGTNAQVSIPDTFFANGSNINAWMWLPTSGENGKYIYKFVLPVERCARPNNYTYSQEQATLVDQAIAALNSAVEKVPQNIIDIFDPGTDYKAGDYVVYDGLVYEFNTDHPAGEWIGEDADEAVIGDAVSSLNKDVAYVVAATSTDTQPSWEMGSINASTGENFSSTTRIRTSSYIEITNLVNVNIESGAKVSIRTYSADGTFVPYGAAWYTRSFNFTTKLKTFLENHPNVTKFRLVAAYVDNAEISDVDDVASLIDVDNPVFISSAELKETIDNIVDNTLSVSGKAADSAVAGYALYRAKSRESCTPAAFTHWQASVDGFRSSNPFGPNDMPMNSYCYVLGSYFTDDFMPRGTTKTDSTGYWIFKYQTTYNPNLKCYLVFSSRDQCFYFGQSITSGSLPTMKVFGGVKTPTIMFFGDSMIRGITSSTTPNSYTKYNLPNLLTAELGCVVDNYGIGSIGWLDPGDATKGTALDYLKRVGDPDWYTDEDHYANNKFLVGEVKTWSDYNTIILSYGGNDRAVGGVGTDLGSLDDIDDNMTYEEVMAMTPTTIVEAMYQCYRYIREQAPNINIILNTPHIYGGAGHAPRWSYPTRWAPSKWSWDELIQMYEEFAFRYGLGCIGNYDAPINRIDPTISLRDNVHPTIECYRQLARHFAGKIAALVY